MLSDRRFPARRSFSAPLPRVARRADVDALLMAADISWGSCRCAQAAPGPAGQFQAERAARLQRLHRRKRQTAGRPDHLAIGNVDVASAKHLDHFFLLVGMNNLDLNVWPRAQETLQYRG